MSGRIFGGEQEFVLVQNGSLDEGGNYPGAENEHNVNDFQVDIAQIFAHPSSCK